MTNEALHELLQAQRTIAELYQSNRCLSDEKLQLQERLIHRLREGEIHGRSVLDAFSDAEIAIHLTTVQQGRKGSRIRVLQSLLLSRKIRRLRLFDFNWYVNQYPDVKASGTRPFRHFLMHGVFEGRDPSPRFNTRRYVARYAHLLDPAEPPLFHYLSTGRNIGLCATDESSEERQTRVLATQVQRVNDQLEHFFEDLSGLLSVHDKRIYEEIRSIENQLIKETKRIFSDEMEQMTKRIDIDNYLIHNQLPLTFRGWPISADLGLILIRLISEHRYDLVIEFGSGTSTVLMAKALQKQTTEAVRTPTELLGFEHLREYHAQTQASVTAQNLQDIAKVHLTTLQAVDQSNPLSARFYDCQEHLREAAKRLQLGDSGRILVLVDGPPGATNRLARLPAFDIVRACFPCCRIDFVLDDYRRPDEQAIVASWKSICQREGIPFTLEEVATEKGSAIFSHRGRAERVSDLPST